LYLPRLANRDVFANTIRNGASSKDFFGTAYGQFEDRFDGFQFGVDNISLDDTLLLIEPSLAREFEQRSQEPAEPLPNNPIDPVSDDILGEPSSQPSEPSGTYPTQPTPATTPTLRAKSFHGTAEVSAATAKMRMIQLADEIAAVLSQDPNAEITITVEISAEFPNGVSDSIKRSVSENARTLGLKNIDWDI